MEEHVLYSHLLITIHVTVMILDILESIAIVFILPELHSNIYTFLDTLTTPSPSPSPSPSPAQCLLTGCDKCNDDSSCCEICTSEYTLSNNCSCGMIDLILLYINYHHLL